MWTGAETINLNKIIFLLFITSYLFLFLFLCYCYCYYYYYCYCSMLMLLVVSKLVDGRENFILMLFLLFCKEKLKFSIRIDFGKANKRGKGERECEEMNKKCIIIFSTALNFAIKFPFFFLCCYCCYCLLLYWNNNTNNNKAYWGNLYKFSTQKPLCSLIIDLFAVCVARRL